MVTEGRETVLNARLMKARTRSMVRALPLGFSDGD